MFDIIVLFTLILSASHQQTLLSDNVRLYLLLARESVLLVVQCRLGRWREDLPLLATPLRLVDTVDPLGLGQHGMLVTGFVQQLTSWVSITTQPYFSTYVVFFRCC